MLAKKYGSYEIADSIIKAKENDKETAAKQIKPHPDDPTNKVQCLGNLVGSFQEGVLFIIEGCVAYMYVSPIIDMS